MAAWQRWRDSRLALAVADNRRRDERLLHSRRNIESLVEKRFQRTGRRVRADKLGVRQ